MVFPIRTQQCSSSTSGRKLQTRMNGRISRITGIFVTLLLCLAFTPAHAEPVSFQWLSVPQGARDVEAVRAIGPDQWQTVPAGQTLNQGFSDDEFWLQVPVPAEPANRVRFRRNRQEPESIKTRFQRNRQEPEPAGTGTG